MKQKKMLLFDSSTLISLATTCSLPILEKLKKDYSGSFVIPTSIKQETIDKAMRTLRFKYEGFRLQKLVDSGVLEVVDDSPYRNAIARLSNLANTTFSARGKNIKIIHPGEISLLVMAHKNTGDDAVVIDERTTRLLVETPSQLPALLSSKLHTNIDTNETKLTLLRKELTGITLLRSADLCLAAYLKKYIEGTSELLESLLWAIKFAGCSISGKEIKDYVKFSR